jgi:hypothetical protein
MLKKAGWSHGLDSLGDVESAFLNAGYRYSCVVDFAPPPCTFKATERDQVSEEDSEQ